MRICALGLCQRLMAGASNTTPIPGAVGRGQPPVFGAQACLWRHEALEIVDVLLQHKVFHGETVRHGGHQMHVHIGMPVGCHREIKRGGGVRHL